MSKGPRLYLGKPLTVSLYRDGKFVSRMINVLPRTARATVEDWIAGGEPWPEGNYEARLIRQDRTIKIYRWRQLQAH
jgi:hypothetical protein